DLDCREAIDLAQRFLRPTATFGRLSKRRSHWLYIAPETKTKKFQDPIDKAMMLEVRSTGCQTVMPGSVHTSGEHVEWDEADDELIDVHHDVLVRDAGKLAAAALLVRYWPSLGARHDAALHLGGALAYAGWKEHDISEFVFTIASAARCDDPEKHAKTAKDGFEKHRSGQPVTGWPTL